MGTQVDTRSGTVELTMATGKTRGNKLKTATLRGAIFSVKQTRSGTTKGLTTAKLLEGLFPGAPSLAKCKAKKADSRSLTSHTALSRATVTTWHTTSHGGAFSTSAGTVSATGRGTAWTVTVRCDHTVMITVQRDVVVVRGAGKGVPLSVLATLHAGGSFRTRGHFAGATVRGDRFR